MMSRTQSTSLTIAVGTTPNYGGTAVTSPTVNAGHAQMVRPDTPAASPAMIDASRQRIAKLIAAKGRATIAQQEATFERTKKALVAATLFCVAFMIVEVIAGIIAHSLAILTDAAHLLTDVGSFMLSLMSIHASRRLATSQYSYGWHRAEVVGMLLSVFTIWALVGGVTIEAVNRIRTMRECSDFVAAAVATTTGGHANNAPSGKHGSSSSSSSHGVVVPPVVVGPSSCEAVDPLAMMIVGTVGIIVNLVCAAMLSWGGHEHSHGGKKCTGHGSPAGAAGDGDHHGHSHDDGEGHHGHDCGGHDDHDGHEEHGHAHDGAPCGGHDDDDDHGHSHDAPCGGHDDDHGHSHDDHGHSHDDDHSGHDHGALITPSSPSSPKKSAPTTSLALNAAFVHALGDSVQSAGVIFAGAAIYYLNKKTYGRAAVDVSSYNILDPACSILFAVVTLFTTRGIVSSLIGILMESTPPHVDYDQLRGDLAAIDAVVSVHDLHVWSLSHERVALSVHLESDRHEEALIMAQAVCHEHGIDHSTIQVDSVGSRHACQTHLGCHS